MIKKISILTFFILISCFIHGQQVPTSVIPDIKSPETHAFEKYGNVPINLYTGSIDLKIPITSISENGVNIPISLNYDSSGFMPHKKSDVAGMGWSLLAGGRITRQLNGTADEYLGTNVEDGYQKNPYGEAIDKNGFLTGVTKYPTTNVKAYNFSTDQEPGPGTYNGFDWWLGPGSDRYEGEPDVFSFNAVGLSGKFIVGNDGKVLVESNDPNIKVDLSQMARYGNKGFCEPPASTITITDGNGTKYVFGGDFSKYEIAYSYSIEPEYPNMFFNGHPMISSFSLAKIIYSTGKEISFDYQEDSFFYRTSFCHLDNWPSLHQNESLLSMESYSFVFSQGQQWQLCPNHQNCWSGGFNGSSIVQTTFSMLKKSVLKSIKYSDDEIKINYDDRDYPIVHFTLSPFSANKTFNEWVIDNVETYHKNILVKKTQFSYDDLGGQFKRPFLKSLTDINSNDKYSFEYYKTDVLPAYYTKGIDHWGYWNSRDDNTLLSPLPTTYNPITGDYTMVDTFRDANSQNYDVALLSKITYPTKGFSIFEYEAQNYGKRVERISSSSFKPTLTNNGGLAGGARIKKTSSYTENAEPSSVKEYKYTTSLNGSTSSGILMHWPRYFYYVEATNSAGYSKNIFNTSTNIQKNSLDSYNVGYSTVFEIEKNKGYTEHHFTTYETDPDFFGLGEPKTIQFNLSYSGFIPLNLYKNFHNLFGVDKSISRGKILNQKFYSQSDLLNPIKTIEYQYTDNMEFNSNSQLDNTNYVAFNHQTGDYWVQQYKKFMNSSFLKKKITRDYLHTAEIKTTTDYIYDGVNHLNLTDERSEDTDGNILEAKYKYAKDYGSTGDLNTWNFTGIPLQTTKYKNAVPVSRTKLNFGTNWKGHSKLLPLSQQSVINLDKIDKPGEVLEDQVTYGEYDNKGNLLEYTTKNGLTTTIIYGYNRTVPIAKIEGIDYVSFMTAMGHPNDLTNYEVLDICQKSNDDSSQAPRSDETLLLTALDTFRKQLPNYKVTTYTYDPLIGVRSITPPNGIRENYTYDEANRLKSIIDTNGRILKEYKYNTSSKQWYYNSEKSGVFRNQTCNNNSVSQAITYTVPAYKYASDINQIDADNKAETDLQTNGQNLANTTTCEYLTCPVIFNSDLNMTNTSSSVYAINSQGIFVLTLSFTTGQDSINLPWEGDPGVKIATIDGNCKPSEDILGGTLQQDGNLVVFWSLKSNGEIYIDNTPAPANNTPTTWKLEIPLY